MWLSHHRQFFCFSGSLKATAVADKPYQSFVLDKKIVAFIVKQIDGSRSTTCFMGCVSHFSTFLITRSVKLSAITFGNNKKNPASITQIALLLPGGRRGMGLFHTCNTPCNSAYNTDLENFARRDLGILGFLLLNPRRFGPLGLLLVEQTVPIYSHLDNLLFKEQPRYSLIPLLISPSKHLALIKDKPFLKVWLITCTEMLSHTRALVGQSLYFSAAGQMQVEEQHAGWILLPGTKTHMQMTTQKVCSGSDNPPKKLNFNQISFLNWPTSVQTWVSTTEMCQSSLIYSSTFSTGQLQQPKPIWSMQFIPAEGVCSSTGGSVGLAINSKLFLM